MPKCLEVQALRDLPQVHFAFALFTFCCVLSTASENYFPSMSLRTKGPHEPVGKDFAPHEAVPQLNEQQVQQTLQSNRLTPKLEFVDNLSENAKTRRLFVTHEFTIEGAAKNPTSTVWRIDQDSYEMLQVRPDGSTPSEPRVGNLSKAVILELKVLEAHSDVPFPLAVMISGIKGNAYSKKLRSPFFMGAHANSIYPEGKVIHQIPKTGISVEDIVYGNITEESLSRLYSPLRDNPEMSAVRADTILSRTITHPSNLKELGINPRDYNKFEIEGVQYYNLNTWMVKEAVSALLGAAKDMSFPTTNLFQFEVGVQHSNGVAWSQIKDKIPHVDQADYLYQLKKPRTVTLELEMTYVPELTE